MHLYLWIFIQTYARRGLYVSMLHSITHYNIHIDYTVIEHYSLHLCHAVMNGHYRALCSLTLYV